MEVKKKMKKTIQEKRKSVRVEAEAIAAFRFGVVALLFLGLLAANANAVRPTSTPSIQKTASSEIGETQTIETIDEESILAGPELKSKLKPLFKIQAVQTLREHFKLQVCGVNGETYDTPVLAQQAGVAVKYVGPCLGGKQEKAREKKCWFLASEDAREACLKKEYGLKRVSERRRACLELVDEQQKTDCLASLKQAIKGYFNNAFKRFLAALDALQAKFEREGLDTAIIIEMRAFVEEKRSEFLNATTPEERKAILQETNEKWREFKQQVLEILHKHLVDKALERAVNALNKIKTTRDELAGKGYNVTSLDAQITVVEQKIAAANETGLGFKEQMRRLLEVKKSLVQARKIIHAILNRQPVPTLETIPTANPPLTTIPSTPASTILPTPAATPITT